MSDVYVVGLGLDYSEFDLWWILNRRLREYSNIGKIYYYEPKSKDFDIKHQVLNDAGIIVKTLNIDIDKSEDKDKSYQKFYELVIKDIENEFNKEK